MLHSVVDVEAQLLEVGDDYQAGIGVLVLVAESLRLDFRQVGGFVVFQFDDANHLVVEQNGSVGFLGVGFVLLFGDEVEISTGKVTSSAEPVRP